MQRRKISLAITTLGVMLVLTSLTFPAASRGGSKEHVLYNFGKSAPDGHYVDGRLISDRYGNLYGITLQGGIYDTCYDTLNGCGTVFELVRGTHGQWTKKVLHKFAWGTDGMYPGNVMLDNNGNLFGTTQKGGNGQCTDGNNVVGCGIVFELSPVAKGPWKETVLYDFQVNGSVYGASGDMIIDTAGNLYGSGYGGSHNFGAVYELMPGGHGQWTLKVLYNFGDSSGDGKVPCCLIRDASWNLYGTNRFGGAYGYGTAFELTRNGGGNWTETVLHDFNQDGKDGWTPGPLTLGKPGNVFGSSNWGGPPGCGDNHGCGIVYQLTKGGNGKWSEKILHTFKNDGKDGNGPTGLVVDKAGNLFGATDNGGTQCNPGGCGIAFELEHGTWTEKVLYNFYDKYSFPYPNLSLYKGRNLYGVTLQGGKYGGGTVFELTP